MVWKTSVLQFMTDALRFIGHAGLLICVVLLSVWLVWFCARFLWHSADYLDRTLFGSPW